MAHRLTALTRPIVRRIGKRLIVRITKEGVELRGYRWRTWHRVTWAEIAGAYRPDQPLLADVDRRLGERLLEQMGVKRKDEGGGMKDE